MKNGNPFRVDQTNNCYIFPGMGLGLIAVKATRVTDQMFMKAAIALADCSPTLKNPDANLLPPLAEIRNVSLKVAIAVAEEAMNAGLAGSVPVGSLEEYIRNMMWQPQYVPYKRM